MEAENVWLNRKFAVRIEIYKIRENCWLIWKKKIDK